MAITAAMVKELRERTGAGMMECKKALVAAEGDMDVAIEQMRISGLAKADKKSSRVAAEGIIAVASSDDGKAIAMLEVNCETDFVAKGDDFKGFVNAVAAAALADKPADVDALMQCSLAAFDGKNAEEVRKELVGRIGENIQVRRFDIQSSEEGVVGSYLHGSRIGVAVALNGGDQGLAKDVAMHIAASRPVCVAESDVPAEMLEKEKRILSEEARESGKPEEIIEKMVQGRLRKYLAEVTLVGQPFVKDPDQTVGKLLQANNASVASFVCFEVGEGIEKKEDNFVEEVMAQAKGAS